MKKYLFLFVLIFALAGCTASPGSAGNGSQPRAEAGETVPVSAVEAEAAALAEAVPPPTGIVLEPEASGAREVRCDTAVVDHSHTEEGYIMVSCFAETDKRLKVLLKGPTTTYQYDLPQGEWAVLPLSDGDGCYQAAVIRLVSFDIPDWQVLHIPQQVMDMAALTSGMVPACEILKMNNAVRNMIRDNKNHQIDSVIASGSREGMISMDQAIAALCREGKISRETALHYADQPEQMKRLIQ